MPARNEEAGGTPSRSVRKEHPCARRLVHVGELRAKPAEDLRIPHKGYRVHRAVSPNPYGGTTMVKFAKLVKSAKIAGGLAGW
jgi:hypothetical protein